jgi:hypothetical protein
METKNDKLREIHMCLMEGQRTHMADLIDNYGLYDFFEDYNTYLSKTYKRSESKHAYLLNCVVSYHRIKNR